MANIIFYFLAIIQEQNKTICWLLNFICRYIPLKQWAHQDTHSPKYQKLKVDRLPLIGHPRHDWDWNDLIRYYRERYGIELLPVRRKSVCDIPETSRCPKCGAPMPYVYKNNGSKGQLWCKVCGARFTPGDNRLRKVLTLRCPYCGHALVAKKNRKFFVLHKCVSANQFFLEYGEKFRFDIIQVIGLANDDEVSNEFRPYKQMVERLNRTFRASYRVSCGYDNYAGANYNVALWVAYYNFLRPHKHNKYQVLNKVDALEQAESMPGKWQLLIHLGQKAILSSRDKVPEAQSVLRFGAGGKKPSHPEGTCP